MTSFDLAALAARLKAQYGALKPTVVIVDMQPVYAPANDPAVLAAVAREIEIAAINGWPVVVLECTPDIGGGTHKVLIDMLESLAVNYAVYPKELDDGSIQVLKTCVRHGFGTDAMRLCGVHASLCVLKTALGLKRLLPCCALHVIEEACGDGYYPSRDSLSTLWPRFTRADILVLSQDAGFVTSAKN